jgi:predicted transcriptional regulator
VTGIDLPATRREILAQMRSGIKANGSLVAALTALDQAMVRHYLSDAPCC